MGIEAWERKGREGKGREGKGKGKGKARGEAERERKYFGRCPGGKEFEGCTIEGQ